MSENNADQNNAAPQQPFQPSNQSNEPQAQTNQTNQSVPSAAQAPYQQYAQPTAAGTPQSSPAPQYGQSQPVYGGYGYAQPTAGPVPPQGAPAYGAYAQPGQPYGGYYPPAQRWNVMSIVGFILSFVVPPAGLVVSIIALMQINKTGEKSKGLTIAGIVVGIVNTLLAVLCVVLFVAALGYAARYGYYDGYHGYGDVMDSGSMQNMMTQSMSYVTAFVGR